MKRTKVPFGVPLLTQGADSVWGVAIHRLTGTLAQKRAEGKFSQVVCDFIWLSFAEVIRLRWDKNFRLAMPRAMASEIKQTIRPAAEVLDCLLDFSIELWVAHPGNYQHPSQLFAEVLVEFEAWGIATQDKEQNTITKFYRNLRTQNAQLADHKNPFTKPATKALIDLAIDLVQRNGRFETTKYNRFVRQRKALTATLKPSHSGRPLAICNQDGIPRIGRTRTRTRAVQ